MKNKLDDFCSDHSDFEKLFGGSPETDINHWPDPESEVVIPLKLAAKSDDASEEDTEEDNLRTIFKNELIEFRYLSLRNENIFYLKPAKGASLIASNVIDEGGNQLSKIVKINWTKFTYPKIHKSINLHVFAKTEAGECSFVVKKAEIVQ